MKKIILTVIVTLVVLAGGLLIYVNSGSYDISQLSPHNGLTKFFILKTKHASIEKRMTENAVPADLKSEENIILGFKVYNGMCTGCHAGPGVRGEEMAKGLYPEPPLLYKHKDEDPQEFFWIIKNGIKLTSMPAYGPTHNDKIIWAMTAFVTEKLPTMSPEEYSDWEKKYGEEDEEKEE